MLLSRSGPATIPAVPLMYTADAAPGRALESKITMLTRGRISTLRECLAWGSDPEEFAVARVRVPQWRDPWNTVLVRRGQHEIPVGVDDLRRHDGKLGIVCHRGLGRVVASHHRAPRTR